MDESDLPMKLQWYLFLHVKSGARGFYPTFRLEFVVCFKSHSSKSAVNLVALT